MVHGSGLRAQGSGSSVATVVIFCASNWKQSPVMPCQGERVCERVYEYERVRECVWERERVCECERE